MIQNPGFLPDHPQNLITCSLCHAWYTLKISERSVHNFLSYLVHTHTPLQTNRQTKPGKNITSLAEVTSYQRRRWTWLTTPSPWKLECRLHDLAASASLPPWVISSGLLGAAYRLNINKLANEISQSKIFNISWVCFRNKSAKRKQDHTSCFRLAN